MPFATTWTDLEGVMPSERNQMEKGTHHRISLYLEPKKTNKNTKLTDTENRLVAPRSGGGGGRGSGWVKWIKKYKFPITKYLHSGDEMYSMVTRINNTVLEFPSWRSG